MLSVTYSTSVPNLQLLGQLAMVCVCLGLTAVETREKRNGRARDISRSYGAESVNVGLLACNALCGCQLRLRGTLCWTLSIRWHIIEIHDVSGVGFTPVVT
jgi:hypothetical protein